MVVLTDGGVSVAHRAFHRWKRPAQRSVVVQRITAPHNVKVALQAEMRFLRFQAPWAYGRNVFALLRRAPAERWANIRYRRMNEAPKRRVRGESMRTGSPKDRNAHGEEQFL